MSSKGTPHRTPHKKETNEEEKSQQDKYSKTLHSSSKDYENYPSSKDYKIYFSHAKNNIS